ncbi:MAG: SH3 domain-containing protein [Deltaproteobacteria bacterium]|nr:SH3 domain-containing protein [Deltaproteobacteria bacterium]
MRSRPGFFPVAWLLLLLGSGQAEWLEKKAVIDGQSHVNLRSEPGLSRSPEIVLKRGEEVTLSGKEGEWYLVSLADGRRGYVHRAFVRLLGEAKSGEGAGQVTSARLEKNRKGNVSVRGFPGSEPHNPEAGSWLIRWVFGQTSWEYLRWAGGVLGIFFIGWICGGNYYLRRDRIRRTRLRF